MNPDAYEYHRPPNTPQNQFKGHHIISDQVGQGELSVVYRELEKVLQNEVPGDVVEFGCYVGTTSLFIRRLLDQHGQSQKRAFHVYDSFAGLPPKDNKDQSAAGVDFSAGKLSVSKKELLHQFKTANLQPPFTHKAWFNELTANDVPNNVAFAFLDGDFYNSILDSLNLVWPRLASGGILLVDDYLRPELPGVERAIDHFFSYKARPQIQTEHNIAIICKSA